MPLVARTLRQTNALLSDSAHILHLQRTEFTLYAIMQFNVRFMSFSVTSAVSTLPQRWLYIVPCAACAHLEIEFDLIVSQVAPAGDSHTLMRGTSGNLAGRKQNHRFEIQPVWAGT